MAKIIIYQVLPRLFGNKKKSNIVAGTLEENGVGKFNAFTTKALQSIKSLGVSHIWFTGIIEHATTTDYSNFGIRPDHPAVVKGKAGSAYAIKDYYDVDPDLAENVPNRMKEFENLVKRTHQQDLKVIIDFVPNHVARQYASDAKPAGVVDLGENDHPEWHFSPLNNFYYLPGQAFQPGFDVQDYTEFPAKATGNDQFTAAPTYNDWYETIKLNYGVNYVEGMQKQFDPIPDTWLKMRDILLFWADKKVDAFRCDMAEMVPVEFWHWAIADVKSKYPDIQFIAEVYNPEMYRSYIHYGGFDFLYDKVGMYDTLKNIVCNHHDASEISHRWQSINDIRRNMLHFLENHDEQRIASDFFAGNAEKIYPALIVSAALTSAPFMIYAGQELGERGMDAEGYSGCDGRTTIFDYWTVESLYNWYANGKFDGKNLSVEQSWIRNYYQTLMQLVATEKALSDGDFYDLQYANHQNANYHADRQFAWFRFIDQEWILLVVNFDAVQVDVEINIPQEALDYMHLKGTKKAVDMLQSTALIDWQTGTAFSCKLQANNGCIIKLY